MYFYMFTSVYYKCKQINKYKIYTKKKSFVFSLCKPLDSLLVAGAMITMRWNASLNFDLIWTI